MLRARHGGLWALLLALCVLGGTRAGPASAQESAQIDYQLLVYDATVAGATAGTATVALHRSAAGYRIIGQAKAQGLLETFSPWRSQFSAHGRWTDGAPQPVRFAYREHARDKRRIVSVQDGTLSVLKNGRQRPQRAALPGLDVLTALFATERCQASMALHTGRHGYQLQSTPATVSSGVAGSAVSDAAISAQHCAYQVTDEDNDGFVTEIRYRQVDGHSVPTRVVVSGPLAGVLQLRKSQQLQGRCEAQAAPPLDYLCGITGG